MNLPTFFLDFETTGLDPRIDEVIEVGLCGHRGFQALVSDSRDSCPEALAVHGLTPEVCQRYGRESAVALEGLLKALGPDPVRIVAHHAAFEQAFLEHWAARHGRSLPQITWECTLEAGRKLVGRGFGLSLRNLAATFGWIVGMRHRAGEDAALTQRLWAELGRWRDLQEALGSEPRLVYLAGPLRGDGSLAAIEGNRAAMARLAGWVQALAPAAQLVIPHLNFAYLDESGAEGLGVRERVLAACEALVSRCDLLVLCGETITQGMAREAGVAREVGLPILRAPGWEPIPQVKRPDRIGQAS